MSMFPMLKRLQIWRNDVHLEIIAASTDFPPLTELVIHCDNPAPMMIILDRCSRSLRHVSLAYTQALVDNDQAALKTLPNLRFLSLRNTMRPYRALPSRFTRVGPNLEFYYGYGIVAPPSGSYNVTGLGLDQRHDLSNFSKLKLLYIDHRNNSLILDIVRDLNDRPWLCPGLRHVLIGGSRSLLKEARELLDQRTKNTGQKVDLEWLSTPNDLLDWWKKTMHLDRHQSCHLNKNKTFVQMS
ncbi:hypothetical protein M408DRAFT_299103 [Serendipita vermifera MAFF 305830]|uniref:F-box domain-containing protein n=1 Tax=Serendipita vermifera MAFF 305830 TaxID=933852 RepID=A0A0C3ARK6_SERVB|nr:hypothetical protein M408DRAFT_299103 [Serendipita vermifera MAFF 305830]